jgi:hypothetical protein
VDDLVLQCILTRECLNKLSPYWEGSFLGDTSLPACMRLPSYEGWNTTTKSLEQRAPL